MSLIKRARSLSTSTRDAIRDLKHRRRSRSREPQQRLPSFVEKTNTAIAEAFLSIDALEQARTQYGLLNPSSEYSITDSNSTDESRWRNRYGNINPFNGNRVRLLNHISGNDYINASPVTLTSPLDGTEVKKRYIVTQGPKHETRSHFWRMVADNAESDTVVIVMLTKLVEGNKIKCGAYYPSAEEGTVFEFGNEEVPEWADGWRARLTLTETSRDEYSRAEVRKIKMEILEKRELPLETENEEDAEQHNGTANGHPMLTPMDEGLDHEEGPFAQAFNDSQTEQSQEYDNSQQATSQLPPVFSSSSSSSLSTNNSNTTLSHPPNTLGSLRPPSSLSQHQKPTSSASSIHSRASTPVPPAAPTTPPRTLRTLTIQHILYPHWPDFGVPTPTARHELLALIRLAHTLNNSPLPRLLPALDPFDSLPNLPTATGTDDDVSSSPPNPLVVHCSAGVGRSGTFVALDYLLTELASGNFPSPAPSPHTSLARIDSGFETTTAGPGAEQLPSPPDLIRDTVNRLREQRMMMVQSREQYGMLYEVVRDECVKFNGRARSGSVSPAGGDSGRGSLEVARPEEGARVARSVSRDGFLMP